MNIKMNLKSLLAGVVALAAVLAFGDAAVRIDLVESVEPWTKVKVNYTLFGIEPDIDYKMAFDVMSRGETRGVTNAAAKLADGPASQEIDVAALFDSPKPDPQTKLTVTVIALKPKYGGVQLWEGGPYWAECNVGAKKPQECGYYFWWGDTNGYVYVDGSWQSADGSGKSYYFNQYEGPTVGLDFDALMDNHWIDASGGLTPEHDAAHAHLGDPWRLPTMDEINALLDGCTKTWTDDWNGTGVAGYVVSGKGDYANKSIFLPITGDGYGDEHQWKAQGFYRTSIPHDTLNAYILHLASDRVFMNCWSRGSGLVVRPVRGGVQ